MSEVFLLQLRPPTSNIFANTNSFLSYFWPVEEGFHDFPNMVLVLISSHLPSPFAFLSFSIHLFHIKKFPEMTIIQFR